MDRGGGGGGIGSGRISGSVQQQQQQQQSQQQQHQQQHQHQQQPPQQSQQSYSIAQTPTTESLVRRFSSSGSSSPQSSQTRTISPSTIQQNYQIHSNSNSNPNPNPNPNHVHNHVHTSHQHRHHSQVTESYPQQSPLLPSMSTFTPMLAPISSSTGVDGDADDADGGDGDDVDGDGDEADTDGDFDPRQQPRQILSNRSQSPSAFAPLSQASIAYNAQNSSSNNNNNNIGSANAHSLLHNNSHVGAMGLIPSSSSSSSPSSSSPVPASSSASASLSFAGNSSSSSPRGDEKTMSYRMHVRIEVPPLSSSSPSSPSSAEPPKTVKIRLNFVRNRQGKALGEGFKRIFEQFLSDEPISSRQLLEKALKDRNFKPFFRESFYSFCARHAHNIRGVDEFGWSIAHYVVALNDPDLLAESVRRGVELKTLDRANGWTPMDLVHKLDRGRNKANQLIIKQFQQEQQQLQQQQQQQQQQPLVVGMMQTQIGVDPNIPSSLQQNHATPPLSSAASSTLVSRPDQLSASTSSSVMNDRALPQKYRARCLKDYGSTIECLSKYMQDSSDTVSEGGSSVASEGELDPRLANTRSSSASPSFPSHGGLNNNSNNNGFSQPPLSSAAPPGSPAASSPSYFQHENHHGFVGPSGVDGVNVNVDDIFINNTRIHHHKHNQHNQHNNHNHNPDHDHDDPEEGVVEEGSSQLNHINRFEFPPNDLKHPDAPHLTWKFSMSFGDDNSSDDDLVTAVRFDKTGQKLAVGDKAGRVCIFEADNSNRYLQYRFLVEFQSHTAEFDYLRSIEIEEKINMLQWLPTTPSGSFLLSSNNKTVKLWKLYDKKVFAPSAGSPDLPSGPSSSLASSSSSSSPSSSPSPSSMAEIAIPRGRPYQSVPNVAPKRVFKNAHDYHINSISVCSDGQTFISADDLRINVWNLDVESECFTAVDIKPLQLDELSEVITCASFHPTDASTIVYGVSRYSTVKIVDLRMHALSDRSAQQFSVQPESDSYLTDVISCVSDLKMSENGRYIIARDYMTVRVWDVRFDARPVKVVPVHPYLNDFTEALQNYECTDDRFDVACSPDGMQFVTGSYNNNFVVHDALHDTTVTVEALLDAPEDPTIPVPYPDVSLMDFGKKVQRLAWHPRENLLAVAGLNKLYIYQALKARSNLKNSQL